MKREAIINAFEIYIKPTTVLQTVSFCIAKTPLCFVLILALIVSVHQLAGAIWYCFKTKE